MGPGDTVFAVLFVAQSAGSRMLDVLEGRFVAEKPNNVVDIEFPLPAGSDPSSYRADVRRLFVVSSRDEAEAKLCDVWAHMEREDLAAAVKGQTHFLPEPVAELEGVWFSQNPLRLGEPQVGGAFVMSTLGKETGVMKCLQVLAAEREHLAVLRGILYTLGYANDYAKKLIGKYMIMELSTMFAWLAILAKKDHGYRDTLYNDFCQEFSAVDQARHFKEVRDHISAHWQVGMDLGETTELWRRITRRNIYPYLDLFERHLQETFRYFHCQEDLALARKVEGFIRVERPTGMLYETFDNPLSLDDLNTTRQLTPR